MNLQDVSKNDDFNSLLQKFLASKNVQSPNEQELRNQLAVLNMSFVERIVKKNVAHFPKNIILDDCFQEGFLGLLKALEKFIPEKNANFQAWAAKKIKFAILDYVRSNDEFSRKLRTFLKKFKKAREDLEILLLRPPTDEEIFQKLNIESREFLKYKIYVNAFQALSLNEKLNSENADDLTRLEIEIDKKTDAPEFPAIEKEIVFDSFHKLTKTERIILALLYVEKLKQKEIAAIVGLSEGRVSQIITELIEKLTN